MEHENYKEYQFVYTDFDQIIQEVIDFDKSITPFLEENPDYRYDSCVSLSIKGKTEGKIQLYLFNVLIWKKEDES